MRTVRALVAGVLWVIGGCTLLVDTSDLSSPEIPAEAAAAADGSPGDAAPPDGGPALEDAESPADAADLDADAGPLVLARDTFTRTVSTSFGTADLGGRWIGSGPLAVANGVGTMSVDVGTAAWAAIESLVSDDLDTQLVVSSDKLGTGNGLYVTIRARQVGAASYELQAVIGSGGTVNAYIRSNTGEITILASKPTVLTVAPSEPFVVRFQATGRSPTHLRAKLWMAAEAEPAGWSVETVDSTPAMQSEGTMRLDTYLSSTGTNGPVVVSIDDVLVRRASLVPH